MKKLAQEYDCLLIDLDGTVFRGAQPTPGAVRSLDEVHARKLFVTNNASRSADQVAAHLRDLGFTATGADVVTSAQSAAHLLAGLLPLLRGGESCRGDGRKPCDGRRPDPCSSHRYLQKHRREDRFLASSGEHSAKTNVPALPAWATPERLGLITLMLFALGRRGDPRGVAFRLTDLTEPGSESPADRN